jgi:hypothetical protein
MAHMEVDLQGYPKATMVEFHYLNLYPLSEVSHCLARFMMKAADDDFRNQLKDDDGLRETFGQMFSHGIDVSDQDASHIKTIERALKNRLFFAVRQRRELEALFRDGHVRSDTKDTVTFYTTTELKVVMYILEKWKRNTDGMEQYHEAGKLELDDVYGGGETFIFHTVASLGKLMHDVSARNGDETESDGENARNGDETQSEEEEEGLEDDFADLSMEDVGIIECKPETTEETNEELEGRRRNLISADGTGKRNRQQWKEE